MKSNITLNTLEPISLSEDCEFGYLLLGSYREIESSSKQLQFTILMKFSTRAVDWAHHWQTVYDEFAEEKDYLLALDYAAAREDSLFR